MKNNIVVKKNELAKIRYSLSLNEQRLLLACISKIDSRKSLDINHEFVITVQEFRDLFDDNHKNTYHNLKLASDKLFDRTFILKDFEGIEKFHWVKRVKYWHDDSKVRLVFSDEIIPYLTSITEKFFKYKLDDVKNFQSVYSLRFYELLHQFQAGGRGAQEIEIDELRLLLNLEDKYSTFGELKRSVIDKAISEINQHSNLFVSYGERKRGKKVVAIQFSFEIKAAIKPLATVPVEKKSIVISSKSDNENERQLLIEQFATSRKRFGDAVNESNVPKHIVEILKNSGRW